MPQNQMLFCDNGHRAICYVSEPCPMCFLDGEMRKVESTNSYLNSQIDEMRIELEDLREKAKAHRII